MSRRSPPAPVRRAAGGANRTAARSAALLTLALTACSRRAPSALDPQGSNAERIAGAWWVIFGMAAAVYVVVAGFIIAALLRGRRAGEERPSRVRDEHFIWFGGIVAPVMILGVVAVITVTSTRDLRQTRGRPTTVEVVGKRWWWAVRYPAQGIVTANEIHVPVGQPVTLRLLSDNVIHSFWVPQLAGKVDMVPGQPNVLRFTPRRAGVYRGECAEFCGLQHANMNFQVIAQPPSDFERWALQQRQPRSQPPDELAASGQAVFMRSSCAGCHAVRGTEAVGELGPDLSDFGARGTIGALTVPNDTGHLSGWIVNAQSIKPGNLMPPITLEPDELRALVAYLQSLK